MKRNWYAPAFIAALIALFLFLAGCTQPEDRAAALKFSESVKQTADLVATLEESTRIVGETLDFGDDQKRVNEALDALAKSRIALQHIAGNAESFARAENPGEQIGIAIATALGLLGIVSPGLNRKKNNGNS